MSAPKFTEGPWHTRSGATQMCSDDTTVCRIGPRASSPDRSWWIFSPANDHGDDEADAKLVAAAPDLYQAAELAEAALSRNLGTGLSGNLEAMAISALRTAIAKVNRP